MMRTVCGIRIPMIPSTIARSALCAARIRYNEPHQCDYTVTDTLHTGTCDICGIAVSAPHIS